MSPAGLPQLLRLKVGGQRDLGVDNELLVARQLDHKVRADGGLGA